MLMMLVRLVDYVISSDVLLETVFKMVMRAWAKIFQAAGESLNSSYLQIEFY